MSDKIIENNQVTIMGEIVSPFTFSHEVFGEGFYMVDVLVKRLSNSDDRIPLMISERLIDVTQDYTGEYIVALHNDSNEERTIGAGERIGQVVFIPYVNVSFVEVDELEETERGAGGFGSTGA